MRLYDKNLFLLSSYLSFIMNTLKFPNNLIILINIILDLKNTKLESIFYG